MDEKDEAAAARIDRLLDAIELVKEHRPQEALPILRQLIQEDHNFEDAWLWMSVAVPSTDQSIICLDNVLRINPENWQAAGALYRLRESELVVEKERNRLRTNRDMALAFMWLLVLLILGAVFFSFFR